MKSGNGGRVLYDFDVNMRKGGNSPLFSKNPSKKEKN